MDLKEEKVLKDQLVMQVLLALKVTKVKLVHLEHKDQRDQQEKMVTRGQLVKLDLGDP